MKAHLPAPGCASFSIETRCDHRFLLLKRGIQVIKNLGVIKIRPCHSSSFSLFKGLPFSLPPLLHIPTPSLLLLLSSVSVIQFHAVLPLFSPVLLFTVCCPSLCATTTLATLCVHCSLQPRHPLLFSRSICLSSLRTNSRTWLLFLPCNASTSACLSIFFRPFPNLVSADLPVTHTHTHSRYHNRFTLT